MKLIKIYSWTDNIFFFLFEYKPKRLFFNKPINNIFIITNLIKYKYLWVKPRGTPRVWCTLKSRIDSYPKVRGCETISSLLYRNVRVCPIVLKIPSQKQGYARKRVSAHLPRTNHAKDTFLPLRPRAGYSKTNKYRWRSDPPRIPRVRLRRGFVCLQSDTLFTKKHAYRWSGSAARKWNTPAANPRFAATPERQYRRLVARTLVGLTTDRRGRIFASKRNTLSAKITYVVASGTTRIGAATLGGEKNEPDEYFSRR